MGGQGVVDDRNNKRRIKEPCPTRNIPIDVRMRGEKLGWTMVKNNIM